MGVVDLFLNNNQYSPGYAIYEDDQLIESDPYQLLVGPRIMGPDTNYTTFISVGGNAIISPAATPSKVNVKYLLVPDGSTKWNITWGGQMFGGPFESDGRPKGDGVTFDITKLKRVNNLLRFINPSNSSIEL